MKRCRHILPAFVLAFGAASAWAEYEVHVVDPPVTNHMILRDAPLPPVCREADTIRLHACRGEYEPASFVVSTTTPLADVRITADAFDGPGGPWSEEALDIRVVEEYYREIPGDRAALIPTLLVHDAGFLDTEPIPPTTNLGGVKVNRSNVARGPRRDAKTLQPVTIERRARFWITVHVPDDARAGTHSTALRITAKGVEPFELSLHVEVYAFELLPPMIEYSIYHPTGTIGPGAVRRSANDFRTRTEEQYLTELRNMLAHGVSNPTVYGIHRWLDDAGEETFDLSPLEMKLKLRESVGMRPRTLYLVSHPVTFWDRLLTPEERERTHRFVRQIVEWTRNRGYEEMFFMAGDEWHGDKLSRERDSMVAVHEGGGKVFAAVVSPGFIDSVGDVLDRPVLNAALQARLAAATVKYSPSESLRHMDQIARVGNSPTITRDPDCRRAIYGVHAQSRKIYTYMNPIGGVPLPDLQRRNGGLGLWRMGFDGSMTWAYTHIATYDQLNQALQWSMVYRTEDGVLDTLHWEGCREGVDDVRYLTTLLDVLSRAAGRFPKEPMIARTHAWLAEIDAAEGDLDAIRREMAQRIIALMKLRGVAR